VQKGSYTLKLSEVKSILGEHKIRPSKRLGQNFLVDKNIQKNIIASLEIRKEETVLEIGAGLGCLTEDLCKRAKRVIAVEKDKRLCDLLLKSCTFSNLELIHGDILDYNFRAGNQGEGVKVVGNLPYYISSPILVHLLNNRDFIDTIFVSLQKEFAQRLIANLGSKSYGAISCLVQFYTEPHFLFTVKKRAFYPVPQVDSCFLKMHVRERDSKISTGLYLTDEAKMFKIIRQSFEKRRKTILNALYSKGGFRSKEEILEKLKDSGISPERRPETISLQEFVKLSLLW